MKTETVTYVVQYKSVYDLHGEWKTFEYKYLTLTEAKLELDALYNVNPNVRLIRRVTIETEL